MCRPPGPLLRSSGLTDCRTLTCKVEALSEGITRGWGVGLEGLHCLLKPISLRTVGPAEATAGRKGNGHLEMLIFGPVNGSGDGEKGVPMN